MPLSQPKKPCMPDAERGLKSRSLSVYLRPTQFGTSTRHLRAAATQRPTHGLLLMDACDEENGV